MHPDLCNMPRLFVQTQTPDLSACVLGRPERFGCRLEMMAES